MKELKKIPEFLSNVESIHFFARSRPGTKQFEYSVICKTKEVIATDASYFSKFASRAVSIMQTDDRQLVYSDPETSLYFKFSNNILILGNSKSWIDEIQPSETTPGNVNGTLAADRRFLRALNSAPRRDYCLFSYFRPGLFQSSFRVNLPSDALRLEDLASGSFFAWIDKQDSFVGVGEISNTFPAKGIPEVWDTLDPISELPQVDLDIIEFYGEGWKPEEMYRLTKDKYDSVRGDGAFETRREKIRKTHLLMDPHSLILRSNQRYSIRYKNEIGLTKIMGIESRVGSKISAQQLKQEILSGNDEEGFGELEKYDGAIAIGFPDNLIRDRQKELLADFKEKPHFEDFLMVEKARFERFKKDGSFESEEEAKEKFTDYLVEDMVSNEGFLISDKWLLRGQLPDLKQQFTNFQEGKLSSGIAEMSELLSEAQIATENKEGPIRIWYDNRRLKARDIIADIFQTEFPEHLIVPKAADFTKEEEKVKLQQLIASNALTATIDAFEIDCKDRALVFFKNASLEYYFKFTTNRKH